MGPLSPKHVPISPLPPDRFRPVVGEETYREVAAAIVAAGELFAGRVIWHVNSTARGGGVAEILQSLLAYVRGAGVDARWVAIRAGPEFFRLTKRIHNNLHGQAGDGGPLGEGERKAYEAGLAPSLAEFSRMVRKGDVVFLHDPQPAGLTAAIRDLGACVVWRCHVGADAPNELSRRAWDFLRPYVEPADAYVFSRRAYVWEGLDEGQVWIVPPSIDVFSPKNQDLDPATVAAILAAAGIAEAGTGASPTFRRRDGTPARIDRRAELEGGPLPSDAKTVIQVSRWDRLKDPLGVVDCFAAYCDDPGTHLVLAAPSVEGVADDPEGAAVLAEVRERRAGLAEELRSRVHLISLPMHDVEENAAIVNALQRRADVVVQKSIAEGFGLTVLEAMWKAKPVVASGVGGIQDQIVDGESGLLVRDPHDLGAFGEAINGLIDDPRRAERIGTAARERVRSEFLGTRHLLQYVRLLEVLVG